MLPTGLKRAWPWVLYVAGGVIALVPVARITRVESHQGRMALSAIALLLIHAVFSWRARATAASKAERSTDTPTREGWGLTGTSLTGSKLERGSRTLHALWLAAVVYGVYNYYEFDRRELFTIGDSADITYYYLNSKYFDELGYDHFYEAMLVADADPEGPGRFRTVERYRDLTNYKDMHPRSRALRHADEIRARFTERRWESFVHDMGVLTKHEPAGGFDYFFIDHGFNPPPMWTLIGGALSNTFEVEQIKWLTSFDIALVVLMMVMIARSFGLQAMLVALTFAVVTFSGRWPILGHALLRFDWLVALVGSACALKTGRHGLAGAALAYAACNRIFPGIFALPYLAWAAREAFASKRLPRELVRFALGAGLVGVLLVGGAWARYGTFAMLDAKDRIALHGSPESFSSHRLGLGHVLLYRGEWSKNDLEDSGGLTEKRKQLWRMRPALQLFGLFALALVLVYAWRSREPPHRLIWMGIFPLFILTTPQINYYNLRLLLVLFHAERWEEPRDRVGLSLLFATELATQAVFVAEGARYAVTATSSFGVLFYLLTMAWFLAFGPGRREATSHVLEKRARPA